MNKRNKSILAFFGLTNLGWAIFKRSTLITALVSITLFFPQSLVNAQEVGDEEEIEFSVDWGDPTPGGLGHSKTPILMPTLWETTYLAMKILKQKHPIVISNMSMDIIYKAR